MSDIDYSSSWLGICNAALGRLGSAPISSFSEPCNNAYYCGLFLPEAVEYVLAQWDFNFSRKRARLARNEDEPEFGWKYQFNLPNDMIRLIRVYGDEEEPPYQIESGKILTDAEAMQIIYTARPQDPVFIPLTARKAINLHLAYLLSTVVASNEQLTGLLMSETQAVIETVKKEDAQMNYDPAWAGEPFYVEKRI
jgi:hypothetical protein